MTKIVEYQLVVSKSVTGVTATVEALMRQSWQPLGGCAICNEPEQQDFWFYQTMVRYEIT